MRWGVVAMLALVLGAFAAHFVLADRGYVLVNFRGYVVEMSVPGLVLVLVAAYLVVRALVAMAAAPRRWRAARAARAFERTGTDLTAALTHLIAGDWARSERLLTQATKQADSPLVNFLLAARAAQLQGATDRRDEWLKRAHDVSAEGATSALLVKAELQLQADEPAAAVATLTDLEKSHGTQPAAASLLARAYRALDDRSGLLALLPRLASAPLPVKDRDAFAVFALQGELAHADLTSDGLAQLWGSLAHELRTAPLLLAARGRALQRLDRGDEAERELRTALKREWQAPLVRCYGEVRGADRNKQLKQAETWLKTHPEDAVLLFTAARLCMASELWGKARSYLESSLALAPEADTYALYGRLLAELGDNERALLAFRSGLGLISAVAAEPWPPSRGLAAAARVAEVKAQR